MKKHFTLLTIVFVSSLAFSGCSLYPAKPQQVTLSTPVQELLDEVKLSTDSSADLKPEVILKNLDEDTHTSEMLPTTTIAGKVSLNVPFIVQAPLANWELPYKEACEEASILMLHTFKQGVQNLSQEEMKQLIDQVTSWESARYPERIHSSAEETTEYLKEIYGYEDISVIYDFTMDDLKAVLDAGYPVVVPAAGRELGNVNFKVPGPIYHMLVVTGYDDNQFITNDPGTRNGEAYRYDHEVFYNAIHDLTPNVDDILQGRKAMIILK